MTTIHAFYSSATQGESGVLDSRHSTGDVYVLLMTDVTANDAGKLLAKGNYIEMQKNDRGACNFRLFPDPETVSCENNMVSYETVPDIVRIKDVRVKSVGQITESEWGLVDDPQVRANCFDGFENKSNSERVVTLVRINPNEKHVPAVPKFGYRH